MAIRSKQMWLSVAVLCAFLAGALWFFMVHEEVDGDDLASSYLGCRLIAAGQASHLYAHDRTNFAAIGPDAPWQSAADASGFQAFMHPYVQTPLWGYALLPVCRHTNWRQFEWIFATLALLSFAAMIFLVARYWAPSLLRPLPLLWVVLVLCASEPFQYSMALIQTHVFFVLSMIAAVMLADRRRPVTAGLLLAFAAAVKVTPAVLIVYWLVRRQWRAAAAAVGWSAALWMATRLVAGPALMSAYGATLERVSHTLLMSMNNQSLAAWWMDRFVRVRWDSFDSLRLPDGLRLVCSGLLAITAALGGWMDGRRGGAALVPWGALVAMVGATVFAPIEWTHYSIVLIAPLMVLVQYARMRRAIWAWVVAGAVLLNLPPLAIDPYVDRPGPLAILRSHFYAEMLCLLALFVLGMRESRRDRSIRTSSSALPSM